MASKHTPIPMEKAASILAAKVNRGVLLIDGNQDWNEATKTAIYAIKCHDDLLNAVKAWKEFWDDMPKGQLGKICCDIGLLNDAFVAMSKALVNEKVHHEKM